MPVEESSDERTYANFLSPLPSPHTAVPAVAMSTLAIPDNMDEDKLSDVVPASNDISRQVSDYESSARSESDEEVDELASDNGDDDPDVSGVSPTKLKKMRAASDRQVKKRIKKDQEGDLQARRKEMDKAKVVDSVKRYSYLLGQTDLFQHFVDVKKERDPEYAKIIDAQREQVKGKGRKKNGDKTTRHRKSEREEDEEMMREGEHQDEDDQPFVFEESPVYINGGTMRDYQIQGLNWMIALHHNGLNGILADEMGLGKTLQTISFLGYLKHMRGVDGPHLIVVPKSTLQNWAREFERWTPDTSVVVLTGTREERAKIVADRLLSSDFDVCITSYEICMREKAAFKKFSFEYIMIDEAHRIKNMDSILSQMVRMFMCRGRLLITGTPLQNNLQELFALLNFICPEIFTDYKDLESFLHKGDKEGMTEEDTSKAVMEALHKILRPFLLRRVKSDVEKSLLPKKEINIYVGLTDMQRKWYRSVLEKDIDAVNGLTGKKEGKTRLMNVVMQLRKVTCHPYLFDGAEAGPPYTTGEHLIDNAGKMIILDKLLKSMKAKGSRVLIFSQMSRVLDILEDYSLFRQHAYCRIDGGTAHEDRIAAIDEYNRPGSEKFLFLLTTRAGGLGINLTSADVVVLYDSDWNPQADLQAMDRAHRIGQTKQVYVFRFITEDSVEERMLERAAQKLRLDQLVIQQGRTQIAKAANKDDLLDMIQHGAEKIVNSTQSLMVDDDIEAIIHRGEERTAELNSKYETLNFEDLSNFKSDTAIQQWEGEDFRGGRKANGFLYLQPSKRERKGNYSIDKYYQDAMRGGTTAKPEKAIKIPKLPKQIQLFDFQFFPERASDLQEKELLWAKKQQEWQVPLREAKTEDELAETIEAERQAEQDLIDAAEEFTEDDAKELESVIGLGFPEWNRRDFQQFVKSLERHGRGASLSVIASEIEGKTEQEVNVYSQAFWQRWHKLPEYQRIKSRMEEGKAKRDKESSLAGLLQRKIESVAFPMQELRLNYPTTKGKIYSEEEDRYLLCRLAHYGVASDDVYDRIKKDITEFPVFRFDWFLKSRTAIELQRRCNTLLGMIAKEGEDEKEEKPVATKALRKPKRSFDEAGLAEPSRSSTPNSASVAKRAAPKKRKV